jgi:colanic acid/amylovoran biosynthesis protein
MRVLETLHAAARAGRPIAMLGQGLGPIGDRSLWRVAREVLPRLHLLSVRDARASLRLAGELGVAADRVVVTGDDTIEMARVAAPAALGGGLGVSIRAADYAGMGRDDLGRIGPIVRDVARQLGSLSVPLPVSGHPTEPDSVSIGLALDGRSEPLDAVEEPRNPRELIGRVGRCRVVVTGSYHAGVFALAQGIPVVALTATRYYADKFAGLEERFPVGCSVVSLRDPGADDRLRAAIAAQWEMAERVRTRLLEAADEQIRSGWSAYGRLETVMAAGPASS